MQHGKFIEFTLGSQNYSLPIDKVKEVISMTSTTPIPNVPKYNLGIINLRGSIVSIMDLRKKMNITPLNSEEQAIVIVEMAGSLMGLVVDSVNKVFQSSKENFFEAPALDSDPNNKYVDAIYKFENSLSIVLDLNAVFNIKEVHVSKESSLLSVA